jgi:hypothetical protein
MRYLLLPFTRRYVPYTGALPFGLAATLALLGTHDLLQTRHRLLRNYPIVGHIRFLLEAIRPEKALSAIGDLRRCNRRSRPMARR